jgi:hypothetical protein
VVKKPRAFNVLQWRTWFQTFFNDHLTLLLGPLQLPPPQEMCDLYFCTFPAAWQSAWFTQGRNIHNVVQPMVEITNFMHSQELVQLTFSDSKKGFGNGNGYGKGIGSDSKKSVVGHHHSKAKCPKKGQEKHHQHQSSSSPSSSAIIMDGNCVADNSPCPVHPHSKHTWGECNANGFKKKDSSGSNNHSQKSTKTSTGPFAHVAQLTESDSTS